MYRSQYSLVQMGRGLSLDRCQSGRVAFPGVRGVRRQRARHAVPLRGEEATFAGEAWLRPAGRGRCRLPLLRGKAGVGKARVISEVEASAPWAKRRIGRLMSELKLRPPKRRESESPSGYSLRETGSERFLGEARSRREMSSRPEAGVAARPWRTISLAERERP